MEINPVNYDGEIYVLGQFYASENKEVIITLPKDWTATEENSSLVIKASYGDKITFQINKNFKYTSSKEIEKEFASYDFDTKATDHYLIDSENCMRVDAISPFMQWSNIYIPEKKVYISAIGMNWELMNAVIESIRIRSK